MNCINCDNEVTGKYCSNCGQRTDVKQINFKEGWHDFWSRVYGFDGMFPRTLRDLTIRPGVVAKEYIGKNRVKYYGPVGYFFFLISLCLLIFSLIDLDFVEYTKGFQSRSFVPNADSKLNQTIFQFVADNIKIFAFLIIPFLALASKYVLFRKSGYNFLEHTILPFYCLGHNYWLNIIFGIILKTTGVSLAGLSGIIFVPYLGLAYSGMMTYQSRWKAFFKGMLIYLVGTILFALFSTIVGFIVIGILAQFNPELYEQIRPSNNP